MNPDPPLLTETIRADHLSASFVGRLVRFRCEPFEDGRSGIVATVEGELRQCNWDSDWVHVSLRSFEGDDVLVEFRLRMDDVIEFIDG